MEMKPSYELPPTYIPFRVLSFCGNLLENVKVPVMLKGRPIVLVGSGGDRPRIWLNIPSAGNTWTSLVADEELEASQPRTPVSLLNVHKLPMTIEIAIGNLPVLRAVQLSTTKAELLHIDLRPLGLNMFGSSPTGLTIGSSIFSNTEVRNLDVWINGG
jgi:hypothetical protein